MQLLGEEVGHVQISPAAPDAVAAVLALGHFVFVGHHAMRAADGRQQAGGVQLAFYRGELGPAAVGATGGTFAALGLVLAHYAIGLAAVTLTRRGRGRLTGAGLFGRSGRGRALLLRVMWDFHGRAVLAVERGGTLGQNRPALLGVGFTIGGIGFAVAAVHVFQLGRPHLAPLLQAFGNVGRARAGRFGFFVLCADFAGQLLPLFSGGHFDEFTAENVLFQVHALGRALWLHVEIFASLARVAGLSVAMFSNDGPELVEVGNALVQHVGQDALFQVVICAFEIIALVAGNNRALVGEFDSPVIFWTGKPKLCIDMFLERLKKLGLLVNLPKRV